MRGYRQRVANAYGKVLRELRKEAGLTQEELASEAGLDRTYPSLLERGLRTVTLTNLISIAKALKVKPDRMINMTAEYMSRQ
jgi:transcriptional regulator with XRE-family HTH domain